MEIRMVQQLAVEIPVAVDKHKNGMEWWNAFNTGFPFFSKNGGGILSFYQQ